MSVAILKTTLECWGHGPLVDHDFESQGRRIRSSKIHIIVVSCVYTVNRHSWSLRSLQIVIFNENWLCCNFENSIGKLRGWKICWPWLIKAKMEQSDNQHNYCCCMMFFIVVAHSWPLLTPQIVIFNEFWVCCIFEDSIGKLRARSICWPWLLKAKKDESEVQKFILLLYHVIIL